MSSGHEKYVAPLDGQDDSEQTAVAESPDAAESLWTPARRAIRQTRQWLLAQQAADGSWCAELEGDTILESKTILLLAFFGHEDSEFARRCAAYIVEKQLPDGGWAQVSRRRNRDQRQRQGLFRPEADRPPSERRVHARPARRFLAHGGADAVNSFTRFYLALLGQISYEQCPAVPPEAVLLPKWFPISLYGVSAWSRTIIVPLSIISAFRPVRRIEPRLGIRELFLREPEDWPPLRCPGLSGGSGLLSWDRFFRTIDRLAKWCQRRRLLPFRRKALAAAERWMRTRFDRSDGLGAIYPPMVWSIIALKCLGYPDDSPEMLYCREELQKLVIEDEQAGHRPASALQVARVGHGDCGPGVGGQRRAARRSRHARGRSTGCWTGRSSGGAIGPRRSLPSRAAGPSSTPTTSIPTTTTRPWC